LSVWTRDQRGGNVFHFFISLHESDEIAYAYFLSEDSPHEGSSNYSRLASPSLNLNFKNMNLKILLPEIGLVSDQLGSPRKKIFFLFSPK
jgi:hypothetical protein